jgi:hypothetical protein
MEQLLLSQEAIIDELVDRLMSKLFFKAFQADIIKRLTDGSMQAEGVKLDSPEDVATLQALLTGGAKVVGPSAAVLPDPDTVVTRYLSEGDRTPRTAEEFSSIILAYLKWAESKGMHPASKPCAVQYKQDVLTPGRHYKTTNKIIGVLGAFGKWAEAHGYGPNPWQGLKLKG